MTVHRNKYGEREYRNGPRLTDEQVAGLLLFAGDEILALADNERLLFHTVEDKLVELGWIDEDPEWFADETINFVEWWRRERYSVMVVPIYPWIVKDAGP